MSDTSDAKQAKNSAASSRGTLRKVGISVIDWLLRTFVDPKAGKGSPVAPPADKNHGQSLSSNSDGTSQANTQLRERYGSFASGISIVLNLVLAASKIVFGLIAGSISIVADGINNLSDASSNIVALIGFKLAARPADASHPYGHGRYEYLSAFITSVLILVVGVELVKSSIERILAPETTQLSVAVVLTMLVSIAVKLWMSRLNQVMGKRIRSASLLAAAQDSKNDVITTSAVLVAALIAQLSGIDLDGWAGLAVGAYIMWSGFDLVRQTVSLLLGQSPDPELVQYIYSTIMSYDGVLGTHDLMVHDYGPGRKFVSAHVEMAAEQDPMSAHDTIDNIEERLLSEGLMCVLHYDPIVTSDAAIGSMRRWISEHITQIHPKLTIHDLRCVPGSTHTNVIFDCVRPHDLDLTNDELKAKISALVQSHYPAAICKIHIDDSYVSMS